MRLRGHSRREFACGKSHLNARPRRVSKAIQSHSMVRLRGRFYATVSHEISAKLRRRKEGAPGPPPLPRGRRGTRLCSSIFSFSQKSRHKTWEKVQWSGLPPEEFTAFAFQFIRAGEERKQGGTEGGGKTRKEGTKIAPFCRLCGLPIQFGIVTKKGFSVKPLQQFNILVPIIS